MATAKVQKRRVYGRFLVGPKERPARGIINFGASIDYIPDSLASDPRFFLLKDVPGVLDAQGYVCEPSTTDPTQPGIRGVELFTTDSLGEGEHDWTWTARPQFRSEAGVQMADAMRPFSFAVPAATPVEAGLDLVKVAKVPASPGLATERAVALVAAAQDAAQESVEAARVAVEAAKGATGPVDIAVDQGILRANIPSQVAGAIANGPVMASVVAGYARTEGNPVNTVIRSAIATLGPITVRHAGDANVPRPASTQVTWIGWVRPAKMDVRDIWFELDRPPFTLTGSIEWASLWTAASVSARGTSDGQALSNWPDLVGDADLTRADAIGAVSLPIFRKSVAAFAGKPAIEFDASPLGALMAIVPQPCTIVFVAQHTKTASSLIGPKPALYRASAGTTRVNAGTTLDLAGSSNTVPHLFIAELNGGSSKLTAGPLSTTGNAGTSGFGGTVYVGGHDSGSHMGGYVALGGVVPGLIDGVTKKELATWVASEYGVDA